MKLLGARGGCAIVASKLSSIRRVMHVLLEAHIMGSRHWLWRAPIMRRDETPMRRIQAGFQERSDRSASHAFSTGNWCLLNHGAISLHVAMVFIASCFIAAISLVVFVACIFLLVSYD